MVLLRVVGNINLGGCNNVAYHQLALEDEPDILLTSIPTAVQPCGAAVCVDRMMCGRYRYFHP